MYIFSLQLEPEIGCNIFFIYNKEKLIEFILLFEIIIPYSVYFIYLLSKKYIILLLIQLNNIILKFNNY